jgi:carnitine O-acetyltransferase
VSSIQFNIVSKHLGCDRMSFFLNEAAGDIREMLMPGMEKAKAKL